MSEFDQHWRQRAACSPANAELFFDPERRSEAKALCEGCPVAGLCHAEAKGRERYGVWGGRDRVRGAGYQPQSGDVEKMRRLRAEGMSLRRIGKHFGADKNTVTRYLTTAA